MKNSRPQDSLQEVLESMSEDGMTRGIDYDYIDGFCVPLTWRGYAVGKESGFLMPDLTKIAE